MSEESKLFYINLDNTSGKRYNLARFMEYHTDNYDPLTSNFLLEVKSLKLGGRYVIAGEDGRPDLLSYRIYGDTQYWWIIMAYNSFDHVNDITNGQEITFPSLSAVEDFYFSLKVRQKE